MTRRPFAKLEQRELAYLAKANLTPLAMWIFVVLRVRLNGATRTVTDGREALGEWGGVSRTSVSRALRQLKARGLIERHPVTVKGEKHSTWRTITIPLRFEYWPGNEALAEALAATPPASELRVATDRAIRRSAAAIRELAEAKMESVT